MAEKERGGRGRGRPSLQVAGLANGCSSACMCVLGKGVWVRLPASFLHPGYPTLPNAPSFHTHTHTHGPPARRPPSPTPSKLTYHGLHAVEERKRRQKEEKVMFYTKNKCFCTPLGVQWTAFIKNSRSELIGKQIRSFFGRPRHRLSPKYSTNWGQLRCLYPPPTQKYYHSCGWKKRIPSVDKCSTHRSGNAQCSFFFKSIKFRKTLLVEENCSANCANVARLQVFAEDRKIAVPARSKMWSIFRLALALTFCLIHTVCAFNVDVQSAVVHDGPRGSCDRECMFGFSVAQHIENGRSW